MCIIKKAGLDQRKLEMCHSKKQWVSVNVRKPIKCHLKRQIYGTHGALNFLYTGLLSPNTRCIKESGCNKLQPQPTPFQSVRKSLCVAFGALGRNVCRPKDFSVSIPVFTTWWLHQKSHIPQSGADHVAWIIHHIHSFALAYV